MPSSKRYDRETARRRAAEKAAEARATLAQGVEHVAADPDALAAHLRFRAHFRTYSFRNALLLAEQGRARGIAARYVKGFKAWIEVGRCVRKGERALGIFAPITRKLVGEEAAEANVPDGTPRPCPACPEPRRGELGRRVVGYRVASVFDISQTEVLPGREDDALTYASPIPALVGDDFAHLRDDLEAVAAALGYTVEVYAPHERPADGFCRYAEHRIGIKRAAPNQQAAVLAHELAHALAHAGGSAHRLGKAAVELQAEGAAYLACYALGLDTAAATLPYLKSYASTGDAGETAEERTARITAHITEIDRIGWHLVELVEGIRHGAPVAAVPF
jgi:antirestriction protein ArdC